MQNTLELGVSNIKCEILVHRVLENANISNTNISNTGQPWIYIHQRLMRKLQVSTYLKFLEERQAPIKLSKTIAYEQWQEQNIFN